MENSNFDKILAAIDNTIVNPSEPIASSIKEYLPEMIGLASFTTALSGFSTTIGFAIPGVGLIAPIAIILSRAIKKYLDGNKEEKERMYREVIRKQQTAINRQQEIQRELEKQLREQQRKNKQNNQDIRKLKQEIKNLEEVIVLLQKMQKQCA